MRYLKYFEAKENPYDLIDEYEDDIIKVLSKYYNTHSGDLCDQINDLIWDSSEDAAERLEEIGTLDEEGARLLVNDISSCSPSIGGMRNAENLLEIYYDCIPFTKSVDDKLKRQVEEIFYDLSDDGDFSISKDSSKKDDRYKVKIKLKDIFKKINFQQITSMLEELGFEGYSANGIKDNSEEYFIIEFWRPISK